MEFPVDVEAVAVGAEQHRGVPRRAGERARFGDRISARSPGLSVCYALRFPELYRELCAAAASCFSLRRRSPSTPGKDHREVPLRARAFENFCWMLAPAQTGKHCPGRVSFGHATIVDPWGTVVAQCGDTPGIAVAEITRPAPVGARGDPALSHRRV